MMKSVKINFRQVSYDADKRSENIHNVHQELDAFVNEHTAEYWANSLVKDIVTSASKETHWGPTPSLEVERLHIEYNESRKRILFFDYDVSSVIFTHSQADIFWYRVH